MSGVLPDASPTPSPRSEGPSDLPLVNRLLIISHVVHYEQDGRLHATGGYSSEIDIWASLFPQVTIAAPLRRENPSGDCRPFSEANIAIAPQYETGGPGWRAKVRQLALLPRIVSGLCREMLRADAIHVRCPGNLGLLGALLAPLFSRRLFAKYAGQWIDCRDEPLTVRMQRSVLRSRWWRGGVVTVYGQEDRQPRHVMSLFASSLTAEQSRRAARSAWARPAPDKPLRCLFVGRLSAQKHADTLVRAISRLKSEMDVLGTIVGDGPERARLEQLARERGVENEVTFAGGLPFERVLDLYETHDALILTSDTEGWPKALVEGMAFGLVCIGSDRGLVPEMLANGRGFVVPPGDDQAVTDRLRQTANNPDKARAIGNAAAAWASRWTRENLRESLGELLEQRWGT